MSNLRRIPIRQEEVFPDGLLFLGIEPALDFEARKAGNLDPQLRDKDSGRRVWQCSVLDPTGEKGKRELIVKMDADVQPVPAEGIMRPVVFEGLCITPWSNDAGRSQLSFRASAFRNVTRPAAQPTR